MTPSVTPIDRNGNFERGHFWELGNLIGEKEALALRSKERPQKKKQIRWK
jgi:hypothetical protein